ncbi:MAG: type IX secretion system protein PorQ [Bacteroidales bacterium]|nr:type IX secretion system protein PorQ [Bacteroidales bacterium]
MLNNVQNYFKSFLFVLLILPFTGFSQSASESTYAFLNLPYSAREMAMGSNFLSIYDHDISLALSNPSLISSKMHNQLELSFIDYFAGINYGSVSYGRTFEKLGTFVASMQFMDYGKFDYASETGERSGNFYANDYALTIGWSRALSANLFIGANLKGLYSAYETYRSFGLAVDVATTYLIPENKISASILFRNIGTQIITYTSDTQEALPFEIQAGFSKELAHLPLRFSVVLTNLQKWDLTYSTNFDEQTSTFTEASTNQSSSIDSFADKLMRHIILGAELKPIPALCLRLGYNYLKRKEMAIATRLSTVGFSWGFGVHIAKFEFNYARNAQHLTPSANYLSISTNLDQFFSY